MNVILLKNSTKLVDNTLRTKRRATFPNAVQYSNAKLVTVRNRKCHTIGTAAARIDKCKVSRAGHRRELKHPIRRARLEYVHANEFSNIASKFGVILRIGTRRVALEFSVNEILRHRWVHRPRR